MTGNQVRFVRLYATDDDSNYIEPSSYGVVWRNKTRPMRLRRVAESEERAELESGEARVYLEETMARQSGRMSFMEQRAYLRQAPFPQACESCGNKQFNMSTGIPRVNLLSLPPHHTPSQSLATL
jgi:hypothetical protein